MRDRESACESVCVTERESESEKERETDERPPGVRDSKNAAVPLERHQRHQPSSLGCTVIRATWLGIKIEARPMAGGGHSGLCRGM